MAKCRECRAELPSDGRFCPNCGTQMGLKKDVYHVSAGGLVGKVKEIVRDANVKRSLSRMKRGNCFFPFLSRGEQLELLP